MSTINIKPSTVLLLVGPSGVGKSQFSQILKNCSPEPVSVISSDNYRYFLRNSFTPELPYSYMDVSAQAFDMLFKELEARMSFPASSYNSIIVVDTTGLNKEFRDKVVKTVKKYNYNIECVIFYYGSNYKNYHGASNVLGKQIRQTQEAFSSIGKKDFQEIHKISKVGDYVFKFNSKQGKELSHLKNPVVIGDIHGQVEALQELISKYPENSEIILVGDYVDKNSEKSILATIEYLYNLSNTRELYICRGNHEYKLYRCLMEGLELSEENKQWYETVEFLYKPENVKYKDKFLTLYTEFTYPYIRYNKEGFESSSMQDVYIVHAPCMPKYIGKESPKALRNMTYMYLNREQDPLDQLKPYCNEKVFPLLIWGHVGVTKATKIFGRIFLDSGADSGNELTGYEIHNQLFTAVPVEGETSNTLVDLNPDYLKLQDVEIPERLYTYKEKVRYISPTMSPADKKDGVLENIEEALEYYFSRNYMDGSSIEYVVIQPKYMGSRLQAYVEKGKPFPSNYTYHKDGWNIYFVTKNGYIVDKTFKDLSPILHTVTLICENENIDQNAILDGELLPWSFFAQGLIDNTFEKYIQVYENYSNMYSTFIGEYPLENLNKFKTELSKYSQTSEVEYKVFDILYQDGCIPNHMYVPDHQYTKYVLKGDLVNIQELLEDHPYKNLEGFVVKPGRREITVNYAPYIKCRNPEYLRLVYGCDYDNATNLPKLITNKRVNHKRTLSIKQYNAANQLLLVPEKDLGETIKSKYLYDRLMKLQEYETTLDVRL